MKTNKKIQELTKEVEVLHSLEEKLKTIASHWSSSSSLIAKYILSLIDEEREKKKNNNH